MFHDVVVPFAERRIMKMNRESLISIPFQKIFKENCQIGKECEEDSIIFCLSIFLQHQLRIMFDDGRQISGILTSISADFIGIDGEMYCLSECSRWLLECEIGVVVDIELDVESICIIPCKYYGMDHTKSIHANFDNQWFADQECFSFSTNQSEDVKNPWEYPILYKLSRKTIDIYGVGTPISKMYFGSLEKYFKNVGAGLIMPYRSDDLFSVPSLRFAAEDLINVMPKELDTYSFRYDVSYTIGFLVDGSPKATNIYKLREVPLRRDDSSHSLQSLYDSMKEATSQWNASTEILALEPLSGDRRYGLLFFYKLNFNFIKIYSLYKNKIYGELTPDEQRMAQLAVIPQIEENNFLKETLNTINYVYLVSFGLNNQIQIVAAYEKKEVWMIQVEEEHLLIVRAPWERKPDNSEFSDESEEVPLKQEINYGEFLVSSLPDIINQEEVYAILHHYAISNPMIYFYSIYDPNIKNEQARLCTVARAESGSVQFFQDGTENVVESILTFNTYKYLYIVRIMPEVRSEFQGAPFVTGAVNIVKTIPRRNCRRLEIEGNLMRIYSPENEGIIQLGILPENQVLPDFIEGETLLVLDKSGQHTVTFHDTDSFCPNEQDIVYRFGLLTNLFRVADSATLIGGCLNHCIYFEIANMGEQIRNIIQTTPKRILLQYAFIDGKVMVDRVLPESVWDISWQKGTVTNCTNSAAELLITMEDGVYHYQSIATDGYVNSAVRNGTLINESVYYKKITCPDWQNREVPRLMDIAPLLHCEWEKAAVLYDEKQKQYYACRYNLTTNILGTIRRVLYGSERALEDAVSQHKDILFQPYGDTGQELIAVLPIEGEERPKDMRMPFNVPEVPSTMFSKSGIMVHQQAQKTGIGFFMLQNAASKRRYLELLSVADVYTLQSVDSQNFLGLKGIFLSENSEDLAIAAKLLEEPVVCSSWVRSAIQEILPFNTHSFLRRAMRFRVAEIVQNGSYLAGEFIAYMLAIIDSDTTPEQRARDLYVYFMPIFQQRYSVQENTLFNIKKPSFASEKGVLEQEFVVKLREWFSMDAFMPDVSALLAQIVALDDASFEYFFDITSDVFSKKIREALLLGCGTTNGAQGMDSLLAALRRKRGEYFERKKECLHLLNEFVCTDGDSEICIYIAERQREMFDVFLPLLDNDDQENVRELLRNCRNVKSSVGKGYAEKMQLLEETQKSISMQRLLISQHPTLVMIELFQNTGLLKRIHGEIIQTINELCQNANSLPDVRCICNYPILVPNQSNFALLLENGKEGNGAHRPIRNPVVSLISKGGISEDGIEHELKSNKSELISGSQETIIVKITLEDVEVGTIIHIGYTVTYQYLDGVSFDDSYTYMNPFWKTSTVEGDLTLHVEAVPDSLRSDKQSALNPYRSMVNRALKADNKMYFGREDEQNELMEYLRDGQKCLVDGKTVIVYGQKQCGKTSFTNRIRKELEGNSRVFVLYYDDVYANICHSSVNALEVFMEKFYGDLLEKLMKELRQSIDLDLLALAERYDSYMQPLMDDLLHEYLEEKTRMFFHLLRELQNISVNQYKIVLIMDEFTRLCNAIRNCRNLHPEYITIPEFLRSFSQLGFIQIVVGHDSMMQTLEDLNILNRTAQTAKVMQLSALREEDAREMIKKPMENIFGFNIYATESGKVAVQRLLVLSGCVPNYLVYLCNKMFQYYQSERKPQIDEEDVSKMLDEFASEDLIGEYKNLFDPLLAEDYDTGDMREDIYTYLTHIAHLTNDRSSYKCAIDIPCRQIGEERSKLIQNMLISRKVLSAGNGMIWINVGLFREHVRMLYGK